MRNVIPEEVVIKPLEITVINDNFEDAFRKFKNLCQREGILATYKEHQRYEKPSEKRRRKIKEAKERELAEAAVQKQILTGEFEKKKKAKELKRRQKIAAKTRQKEMENNNEG